MFLHVFHISYRIHSWPLKEEIYFHCLEFNTAFFSYSTCILLFYWQMIHVKEISLVSLCQEPALSFMQAVQMLPQGKNKQATFSASRQWQPITAGCGGRWPAPKRGVSLLPIDARRPWHLLHRDKRPHIQLQFSFNGDPELQPWVSSPVHQAEVMLQSTNKNFK